MVQNRRPIFLNVLTYSIFESEKLRKSFEKRNTEDRGGCDGMMGLA
jgi:hypothetical protein